MLLIVLLPMLLFNIVCAPCNSSLSLIPNSEGKGCSNWKTAVIGRYKTENITECHHQCCDACLPSCVGVEWRDTKTIEEANCILLSENCIFKDDALVIQQWQIVQYANHSNKFKKHCKIFNCKFEMSEYSSGHGCLNWKTSNLQTYAVNTIEQCKEKCCLYRIPPCVGFEWNTDRNANCILWSEPCSLNLNNNSIVQWILQNRYSNNYIKKENKSCKHGKLDEIEYNHHSVATAACDSLSTCSSIYDKTCGQNSFYLCGNKWNSSANSCVWKKETPSVLTRSPTHPIPFPTSFPTLSPTSENDWYWPKLTDVTISCESNKTSEFEFIVPCKIFLHNFDKNIQITISSNDTSEGKFRTPNLSSMFGSLKLQFGGKITQHSFFVQGIRDEKKDGDKIYCLYISDMYSYHAKTHSQDSSPECRYNLINRHILFPHIHDISPSIVPLESNIWIIVEGWHFSRNITAYIGGIECTLQFVEDDTQHSLFHTGELRQKINITTPSSPQIKNKKWTKETYISLNLTNPSPSGGSVLCPGSEDPGYSISERDVHGFCLTKHRLYYTSKCEIRETGLHWYGNGTHCAPCGPGVECPGGFRAWPLPGYWKDMPHDERLNKATPCSIPRSHCLGGPESKCMIGYTGKYCADCDHQNNYYREDSVCLKCDSELVRLTQFIFVLAIACLFFGVFFIAIAFFSDDLLDRMASMTVTMQQTIGAIRSASFTLPAGIRKIVNVLRIFLMDYTSIRTECQTWKVNYPNLYLMSVIFIFGVLIVNILGALVYQSKYRKYRNEKWITNPERPRVLRAITITFHLAYFEMCTRTIKMITCVKVADDESFHLLIQLSQTCYNGYHLYLSILAWFMLVVLIAIPALYLVLLTKQSRKGQLDEPKFQKYWNFLISDVNPKYFWFRILSYLVSFIIALQSTAVFHDATFYFVICFIIFQIYTAIAVAIRPLGQTREYSNLLHFISGVIQCGIMITCVFMNSQRYYIGILLLGSWILIIAFALVLYRKRSRTGTIKLSPHPQDVALSTNWDNEFTIR